MNMKQFVNVKSAGIAAALAGLAFAGNVSAVELISAGSPVCNVLGLLPYGGGVLFLAGGSVAAYHYMRGDTESRQAAKFRLEGLLLGGALLLLMPLLVQYVLGFAVCAA